MCVLPGPFGTDTPPRLSDGTLTTSAGPHRDSSGLGVQPLASSRDRVTPSRRRRESTMAAVVHHVDSPGSASGSGGGSEPSPTPAGSEGLTVSSEPSSTPSSGTTLVASSNLHAHPAASSSTNVGVFVKMARQRSRQSDREKLVPVPVDSAAPAAPEETHAVPPTKEKRNPLARFMKGAQVGRRKASSSQAPPPSQPNSESGPSSPAMSRGNSANGSGTNSGASSSQGHAPVTLPPKVRHVKPLHLPGSKSILGAVMDDWPMFSGDPNDYEIAEPIGYGASSVVYLAHYLPLNRRPCAIKVVDVDRLGGGDVERLKRETQLMSLAKHPNVLRVRGEWIEGSRLFIAVRLMASGSLHDIMRYSFPEGFSEEVVATVLQQVLRGLHCALALLLLTYITADASLWADLHINGWIHRDIKAANLLVDDDGTVLVSDFGVSANLEAKADGATDDGKKPRRRTSFVGTPCWMAPEVVEGKGYNDRADIVRGLVSLTGPGLLTLSYGSGRLASRRSSWRSATPRSRSSSPPKCSPRPSPKLRRRCHFPVQARRTPIRRTSNHS